MLNNWVLILLKLSSACCNTKILGHYSPTIYNSPYCSQSALTLSFIPNFLQICKVLTPPYLYRNCIGCYNLIMSSLVNCIILFLARHKSIATKVYHSNNFYALHGAINVSDPFICFFKVFVALRLILTLHHIQ